MHAAPPGGGMGLDAATPKSDRPPHPPVPGASDNRPPQPPVPGAIDQGLTLVYFSAQRKRFR